MRNVFDQYSQPENRITHALVTALNEDRKLLNKFLHFVVGSNRLNPKKLKVLEQSLPGISEPSSELDSSGLPDAWIHDNDRWCLLIESKVTATLKMNQLNRHVQTARSREFEDIILLAIDSKPNRIKLPDNFIFKEWSEIYVWLKGCASFSEWAARTASYFEIAEQKMISDKNFQEGSLTVFSGIPFDGDNPYYYGEAKRLLKLAMKELRGRKELLAILGMNPKGLGRGAITGKEGPGVWDYIPLKVAEKSNSFTKYPHLTLAFQKERVLAIITIPHGITPAFRRNIINLGYEGFVGLMELINKNLIKMLRNAKGGAPWAEMVQRRYPSQRSTPIVDAKIEFDLRTAFSIEKKSLVKPQPQWLDATYDALITKRSNLQFAIGAMFPYKNCGIVKSPAILDYVAKTWIACKPLLDVMLKK